MALVCPQCKGSFDKSLQCPSCGVRLLYESRGERAAGSSRGFGLQAGIGRIAVGIVLAQGLAYGLQMLCHAFVQVAADDPSQSIWTTLYGLVLLQCIQGFSLLAGGALAGAGKRQAALLGAVVGLVHGLIFLVYQHLRGEHPTEVALYGQPLLHISFGALGAVLGAQIWQPLPVLAMPEFGTEKQPKPAQRRSSLFASLRGPVSWSRVSVGIVIITAGFLWGPSLLALVLRASNGTLKLNDQLQAQLVTWEIIGLITLLGAAVAGATARNGTKHGLCAGIGAAILLIGNHLGGKNVSFEMMFCTLVSIVCLSFVGGWFGGTLFPAVVPLNRRKASWNSDMPVGHSG